MNKLQYNIPDEMIYKYYVNQIPKRRFIKWVKKVPENKKLAKVVDKIKEDMGVSKNEAKMILDHFKKI